MYRYIVDNAITYTPEDFVLYRESPFACWMERLTLENPDHGIPADASGDTPASGVERQDDIAETLRDEGRDAVLVDWEMAEPERRSATLEAMRSGADFVVNGQLALGPLSGAVNLLMRTSGYSDLGDYLYVPCDTQGKTTPHSAFRLCFLADLLHMLQGQLPPQMLIIRGGSDVVPLQTEEHIYHYRAVKQRFMTAMREFRKHRMPDPAESAHFGRWSDCAHEVLKQRALQGGAERDEEPAEAEAPVVFALAEGDVTGLYPPAEPVAAPVNESPVLSVASVAADARRAGELQVSPSSGGTLAEQARQLSGAARARTPRPAPGHTPNLAPVMAARGADGRRADGPPGGGNLADVTLQNLEFIGSKMRRVEAGPDWLAEAKEGEPAVAGRGAGDAPEQSPPAYTFPAQGAALDPQRPSQLSREEQVPRGEDIPVLAEAPVDLPAMRRDKRHPLDSPAMPAGTGSSPSVIDRDDSPPAPQCSEPVRRPSTEFSDSLITNGSFEERD